MADSAAMNLATSVDRESFASADGPALLRALHQNEQRQRVEATEAGYRHRLLTAAGVDPAKLSTQAQRILGWLCGWDEWTVGGLVEIVAATRTAAQVAVHREGIDRKVEALRESEAAVEGALARYDNREESAGRDAGAGSRGTDPESRDGTERFTYGLVINVAEVLEAHGYERCDGRQLVELRQHLLHFLHARSERCTGGAR